MTGYPSGWQSSWFKLFSDMVWNIRGLVNTISTNVSSIKSDVSTLKTNSNSIYTAVSGLATNISSIKTNTDKLSDIKTDISSIKTSASSIDSDSTIIRTKVNNIDSNVFNIDFNTNLIKNGVSSLATDSSFIRSDVNSILNHLLESSSDALLEKIYDTQHFSVDEDSDVKLIDTLYYTDGDESEVKLIDTLYDAAADTSIIDYFVNKTFPLSKVGYIAQQNRLVFINDDNATLADVLGSTSYSVAGLAQFLATNLVAPYRGNFTDPQTGDVTSHSYGSRLGDWLFYGFNYANESLGRLAFVLANDDDIQAKKDAHNITQSALSDLTDSSSGVNTDTIGSIKNIRGQVKDIFDTGASASDFFDGMSGGLGWFSSEVANSLDEVG